MSQRSNLSQKSAALRRGRTAAPAQAKPIQVGTIPENDAESDDRSDDGKAEKPLTKSRSSKLNLIENSNNTSQVEIDASSQISSEIYEL